MRAVRRMIGWSAGVLIAAAITLSLWAMLRARPQDLPWTSLDLAKPVGMFTGRKLAALNGEAVQCRALLARAGIRYTALPPLDAGQCGYDDAVRLAGGGARRVALSPAGVGMACPVAAALALWEWDVVQPAAERHLGSPVVRIEHLGSYNCRRMYGRSTGGWSEHARANALDIAGFVLADGRRITLIRDWEDGAKGAFLHEVRDGACDLFATVLSPNYNAAHRDHFHLDQAARGATGWRACR